MRLPKWLRRPRSIITPNSPEPQFGYSRVKEMLEESYQVGYTDGKREGIALSRHLAEEQLRRVLWQQNQNHSTAKTPTQKS